MKDIVIYGAGGFGREIACLINRVNSIKPEWNLLGFLDDGEPVGTKNEYGEVLGNLDFINSYPHEISVVLAIGTPHILQKLANAITNPKVNYPNIVDPDVFFLDKNNISMGRGNVICAQCVVSCNVKMGDFNLFNIGAGIGHDTHLDNYNVIMPNVNISGGVVIGNCNLLGVKSTVLQYLKIGNRITIGANSLLIRNAKDDALYIGNPAKKVDF
ncbi:MAG: NeuD/PglB/VioB family sugar acetyltransferase [Bacteroidales bacterium]|nr:NeuD/PglB/VioB family sugar acetyltransferase [Bacteroidales bacterium]